MSLVSLVRGRRGVSGYGYASTAEDVTRGLNLRGQNILVTGVGSGLGAETARVLQLRGATIYGVRARSIKLPRRVDASARVLCPWPAICRSQHRCARASQTSMSAASSST